VNEKIEGFFRVCSTAGLTGDQGVMIPAANVGDLHLSDEVAAAVKDGRFNVWAVDSIEDGIKLLTGRPAGTRDNEGRWTEGSVFAVCQERLDEMVSLMRKAAKGEAKNDDEN
jgi:predicted ATP-dependent protease